MKCPDWMWIGYINSFDDEKRNDPDKYPHPNIPFGNF
jgi:hypothetical protein